MEGDCVREDNLSIIISINANNIFCFFFNKWQPGEKTNILLNENEMHVCIQLCVKLNNAPISW